MSYLSRHAEKTISELSKAFGAVLVTGARQVGKSTLLEHHSPDIARVTLDDAASLRSAHESPETFLDYNPPPLLIDEIQKAPALFPEIKKHLDATRGKGRFFLSGSQQFQMMQAVSESLAGRVGILHLPGLSLRERTASPGGGLFLPDQKSLARRAKTAPAPTLPTVWKWIHRGDKPELVLNKNMDWSRYYGAYVQTYVERDIRELAQVADLMKFQAFMSVAAARIGQLLNLSDIARDCGISQPTAERWLSVLIASGVVFLLRPWHANLVKRSVKTPKLYFMDTGLAAYLTRWTTPEVLSAGAMSGPFLENFVVIEILKTFLNAGELNPSLYFYRDKDLREIDLLIVRDGLVHPLEIKKNAAPSKSDIAAFAALDKLPHLKRAPGGVICPASKLLPLSATDAIIPLALI